MTAIEVARVGLRVDVVTLRGARRGVPTLLKAFERHGMKATFFFAVGPDNLGRYLWQLLRPRTLYRAFRTRAPALYGRSMLLSGTLWPGQIIGEVARDILRRVRDHGHEIGLHGWDHHAWTVKNLDDAAFVRDATTRAVDLVTEVLGRPPAAFAAPNYRLTAACARILDTYPFDYRSDCHGFFPFLPVYPDGGQTMVPAPPQVPVTLPTYDEFIRRDGVTEANYKKRLLALLRAGAEQVLAIQAEVEGIRKAELFDGFLWEAAARGVAFTPLSALLPPTVDDLPRCDVAIAPWPGRSIFGCRQVLPCLPSSPPPPSEDDLSP